MSLEQELCAGAGIAYSISLGMDTDDAKQRMLHSKTCLSITGRQESQYTSQLLGKGRRGMNQTVKCRLKRNLYYFLGDRSRQTTQRSVTIVVVCG